MEPIRFKFAPQKAFAAVHWMVDQDSRVDLHTALKACYFADKDQLNTRHRPIFGATYQAMKFGPVPLEIYEIMKGEALWLAELGRERFPWRRAGYHLIRRSNSEPDLEPLSNSDFKKLKKAFEMSKGLTFDERTELTHGRDWQKAKLGIMRYEDMLEETDNKAEIIEKLQESARFMKL